MPTKTKERKMYTGVYKKGRFVRRYEKK